MNVTERFSLLVRGSLTAVLDSIEDPERSLNQLVLDMEEEVEAAKRAAAQAMAAEDRLRDRIAFQEKDASHWQRAGERAHASSDGDETRDCLRRAELAERQRDRLREQLATQESDTADVRESVGRMNERLGEARGRLQVLQARLRQGEARRAVSTVMRKVERSDLHSEFDRLSDRIEDRAAVDRAYQKLDDEVRGDDLRRRVDSRELDEAVEQRLARLAGAEGDTEG